MTADKNEICEVRNRSTLEANFKGKDDHTTLHAAGSMGHLAMVKILLEGEKNAYEPEIRGWTPKAIAEQQGDKSLFDLLLSYENKRKQEHSIEFSGTEGDESTRNHKTKYKRLKRPQFFQLNKKVSTSTSTSTSPSDMQTESVKKRVTIHMGLQNRFEPNQQQGKLIILPDSIEEMFKIAGKLFDNCGAFFLNLKHVKSVNFESCETIVGRENHKIMT